VNQRLAGKAAIVFGGGRGPGPAGLDPLGFAAATTFARHGARVAVVDRDAVAAGVTTDAILGAGGDAVAITADATADEQVQAAVTQAVARFGRLDIVHNNIGGTTLGGPLELTIEQWRQAISLNLDPVFLAARAALPHLLERGGAIVNVSSVASIRWTGYRYPAYAAAKAAVNQLTRFLALEYADRGIRVNAVLAGLLDTPLVYRELAGDRDPAQVAAERDRCSPTGRAGRAQDVADAALFLASDEAAYITGVLLPVDGGLHVRAI